MGFDVVKFRCDLTSGHKCDLCHQVLDNPVRSPCGHTFCSGCVLPPVIQNALCPAEGCGREVTADQLKNVLELRTRILCMPVICDFSGCGQVVSLEELTCHLSTCDHRPVRCHHQGCTAILPQVDVLQHETGTCPYRPAGICQQGCGLLLRHNQHEGHECVKSLLDQLQQQERSISSLEGEVSTLRSSFQHREKLLLARISSLHHQIQTQTREFQNRLRNYQSQVVEFTRKAAVSEVCLDSKHSFILKRENQSMGFNIMGGYNPGKTSKDTVKDSDSPGDGLQDGIRVSRLTDRGPAARAGMLCGDYILQVNGHDLSTSSHEDAVQAFQTAKEPIIVEVLRRVSKDSGVPADGSPAGGMRTGGQPAIGQGIGQPGMVTTSTQTEEYTENTYCNIMTPPPPPPRNFCPNTCLIKPSSRRGVAFSPIDDLGLTDIELTSGLVEDDSFEDGKTYDMEYEEVTLCRTSGDQKVGLTLCYGSTEDEITDIFISEVEQDSIAANDGRIREGDQILQINGVDVRCREEAIELFAGSQSHITLLLARPQLIQMDDGFMEGRCPLQNLDILDRQTGIEFSAGLITQAIDEEGGTTDTATTENSCHKQDKDSGVGRTDDSTRNDESSEQELMENDCTSPSSGSHFTPEGLGNADLHLSNDSFTSNDTHDHECGANEIAAEECDKFREVLETRCATGGGVEMSAVVPDEQGNHLPRQDSHTSLEREIAALNKEMEDIQLECQQIIDSHAKERHKTQAQSDVLKTDTTCRVPRLVPKMGTRLDYMKQVQAAQEAAIAGGPGYDPVWMRKEQVAFLEQAREVTPPLTTADHGATSSPATPVKSAMKQQDTCTSAYPAGDTRSTPLTLELHKASETKSGHKNSMLCLSVPPPPPTVPPKKVSHSDSEKPGSQPVNLNLVMREWCSDGDHRRTGQAVAQGQANSRLTESEAQRNESLQDLYAQYADVMYTNTANLQHTIMVQQKLFQQQLSQRGTSNSACAASPPPTVTTPNGNTHSSPRRQNPLPSPSKVLPSPSKAPPSPEAARLINNNNNIEPQSTPNTTANSNSDTMEWVVKRRADGSRYITRRPVRSKILKERARKLTEERAGMTTDDDAMSELKVGKYWSREDRKRHLEKARDHRKRKEQMIQTKMETVKEKDEGNTKKEVNIVELSHRKMMRHKERKVLDDFTTLQEMMAHGSRDHQGKQTYNPLLSVTTV